MSIGLSALRAPAHLNPQPTVPKIKTFGQAAQSTPPGTTWETLPTLTKSYQVGDTYYDVSMGPYWTNRVVPGVIERRMPEPHISVRIHGCNTCETKYYAVWQSSLLGEHERNPQKVYEALLLLINHAPVEDRSTLQQAADFIAQNYHIR